MKTVYLGSLAKNRRFRYSGRPYKVITNLGIAGVSVRCLSETTVTLGSRTFTAHERSTQVWSAGAPVEIEDR